MIDKFIVFLTFIPWIMIYITSSVNALKNELYEDMRFKDIKKDFFKIFRIDMIFLVSAFFYFSSFNKEFVNKYLFGVICIYLFVNGLYEFNKKKVYNFYRNNIALLGVLTCFMVIPFGIYFVTKSLVWTYRIMMLYLVFLDFLVIIIKKIKKKFQS